MKTSKRTLEGLYQEKQSLKKRGNRKVPSQCNNLREINCKIYPLSKEEEGHVQQFLREEQKRGYIGQGTAPAFIKTRRKGDSHWVIGGSIDMLYGTMTR